MDLEQMAAAFTTMQAEAVAVRDSEPRERITAGDPSGAAEATLAEDGLPAEIVIDREWKSRVRPEALGEACERAIEAALEERRHRWSQRAAEARDRLKGASAFTTAPRFEQARQPARSLEELAEELGRVDVDAELAHPEGTEPAGEAPPARKGHVRVIGTAAGDIRVRLDGAWAASQQTPVLNRELAEALSAFRASLEAPRDDLAAYRRLNARMDDVFAEAMAHLTKLGRA